MSKLFALAAESMDNDDVLSERENVSIEEAFINAIEAIEEAHEVAAESVEYSEASLEAIEVDQHLVVVNESLSKDDVDVEDVKKAATELAAVAALVGMEAPATESIALEDADSLKDKAKHAGKVVMAAIKAIFEKLRSLVMKAAAAVYKFFAGVDHSLKAIAEKAKKAGDKATDKPAMIKGESVKRIAVLAAEAGSKATDVKVNGDELIITVKNNLKELYEGAYDSLKSAVMALPDLAAVLVSLDKTEDIYATFAKMGRTSKIAKEFGIENGYFDGNKIQYVEDGKLVNKSIKITIKGEVSGIDNAEDVAKEANTAMNDFIKITNDIKKGEKAVVAATKKLVSNLKEDMSIEERMKASTAASATSTLANKVSIGTIKTFSEYTKALNESLNAILNEKKEGEEDSKEEKKEESKEEKKEESK